MKYYILEIIKEDIYPWYYNTGYRAIFISIHDGNLEVIRITYGEYVNLLLSEMIYKYE